MNTGAFSLHVIDTTYPNVDLNGSTIASIRVVNGYLVIASDEGVFQFSGVAPLPEPDVGLLMLGGGW